MNIFHVYGTPAAVLPSDASLTGTADEDLITEAQARLDAQEAIITAATSDLQTACAQAFREDVARLNGVRYNKTITDLVATITAAEGKVAFYTAAIVGLGGEVESNE
jgi:hypothetical protein